MLFQTFIRKQVGLKAHPVTAISQDDHQLVVEIERHSLRQRSNSLGLSSNCRATSLIVHPLSISRNAAPQDSAPILHQDGLIVLAYGLLDPTRDGEYTESTSPGQRGCRLRRRPGERNQRLFPDHTEVVRHIKPRIIAQYDGNRENQGSIPGRPPPSSVR